MNLLMLFLHSVLMMGTLAVAADYYDATSYTLPVWFEYFVYAGVFGVSVVWALGHAAVGCVMGITAGGVWEGIKMGLILGAGLSLGRLWPYLLVLALGAFLFHSSWAHIIGLLAAAVACFGVNMVVKFVWSHTAV